MFLQILGCPWFILQDNEKKKISFGEILRFEWLDEILTYDDKKLEGILEEEQNPKYDVVDKNEIEKFREK